MMNKEVVTSILAATAALGTLMVVWPNFIHETLHYFVLKATNTPGYITFDFTPPIRPTTTHLHPFDNVAEGLLFRTLPSIFSIIIVAATYFTRKHAALLTHTVLPAYLTFDIVVNILGFNIKYNDFAFLRVFNPLIAYALAGILLAAGLWVVLENTKEAARVARTEGLEEALL